MRKGASALRVEGSMRFPTPVAARLVSDISMLSKARRNEERDGRQSLATGPLWSDGYLCRLPGQQGASPPGRQALSPISTIEPGRRRLSSFRVYLRRLAAG